MKGSRASLRYAKATLSFAEKNGSVKDVAKDMNDLVKIFTNNKMLNDVCLLYTSPSPRDLSTSRMPSSA